VQISRSLAPFAALGLSAVVAGCEPTPTVLSGADATAIQRAALSTLFIEREHSQLLVLIDVARDSAPVLHDTLANPDRAELQLPDSAALALPIAVRVVTLRDVETVFREHADGWAAWYRRYPVSAGIVELTAPTVSGDARESARIVVARACGEHCRAVWRVTVQRDRDGRWRTVSVAAVGLPKG